MASNNSNEHRLGLGVKGVDEFKRLIDLLNKSSTTIDNVQSKLNKTEAKVFNMLKQTSKSFKDVETAFNKVGNLGDGNFQKLLKQLKQASPETALRDAAIQGELKKIRTQSKTAQAAITNASVNALKDVVKSVQNELVKELKTARQSIASTDQNRFRAQREAQRFRVAEAGLARPIGFKGGAAKAKAERNLEAEKQALRELEESHKRNVAAVQKQNQLQEKLNDNTRKYRIAREQGLKSERVSLLIARQQINLDRLRATSNGKITAEYRKQEKRLIGLKRTLEGITKQERTQAQRDGISDRLFDDGGAFLFKVQAQLRFNYLLMNQVFNLMNFGRDFVIQLDKAFYDLQAITNTTNTEMVGLRDSLIDVSAKTKFTAVEVAEAAKTMGQAGFSSKQITDGIEAITLLAAATGSELAPAVDIVTSSMSVFNKSGSDTGEIVNTFTAAINNSKLTMEKLTLGMQYAGNIASQAGLEFDEVVASLGAMANAGIRSGSNIGTGMRRLITSIQSPTKELQDTFAKLGISMADVDLETNGLAGVLQNLMTAGFDSATAMETLDIRAGAAFAALSNNVDTLNSLRQQFILSTAATKANATQMGSLSNKLKLLQSAAGVVITQMFEPLLNLTKLVVDGLAAAALVAKDFSGTLKILGSAIGALGIGVLVPVVVRLVKNLFTASAAAKATAASFVTFGNSVKRTAPRLKALGVVAGRSGTQIGRLTTLIRGIPAALGGGLVSIAISALSFAFFELGESAETTEEKMDKLQARINETKSAFEDYQQRIDNLDKTMDNLNRRHELLENDQGALRTEALKLTQQFEELAGSIDFNKLSVDGLIQSTVQLKKEMLALQKVNAQRALEAARTELTQNRLNFEKGRDGDVRQQAQDALDLLTIDFRRATQSKAEFGGGDLSKSRSNQGVGITNTQFDQIQALVKAVDTLPSIDTREGANAAFQQIQQAGLELSRLRTDLQNNNSPEEITQVVTAINAVEKLIISQEKLIKGVLSGTNQVTDRKTQVRVTSLNESLIGTNRGGTGVDGSIDKKLHQARNRTTELIKKSSGIDDVTGLEAIKSELEKAEDAIDGIEGAMLLQMELLNETLEGDNKFTVKDFKNTGAYNRLQLERNRLEKTIRENEKELLEATKREGETTIATAKAKLKTIKSQTDKRSSLKQIDLAKNESVRLFKLQRENERLIEQRRLQDQRHSQKEQGILLGLFDGETSFGAQTIIEQYEDLDLQAREFQLKEYKKKREAEVKALQAELKKNKSSVSADKTTSSGLSVIQDNSARVLDEIHQLEKDMLEKAISLDLIDNIEEARKTLVTQQTSERSKQNVDYEKVGQRIDDLIEKAAADVLEARTSIAIDNYSTRISRSKSSVDDYSSLDEVAKARSEALALLEKKQAEEYGKKKRELLSKRGIGLNDSDAKTALNTLDLKQDAETASLQDYFDRASDRIIRASELGISSIEKLSKAFANIHKAAALREIEADFPVKEAQAKISTLSQPNLRNRFSDVQVQDMEERVYKLQIEANKAKLASQKTQQQEVEAKLAELAFEISDKQLQVDQLYEKADQAGSGTKDYKKATDARVKAERDIAAAKDEHRKQTLKLNEVQQKSKELSVQLAAQTGASQEETWSLAKTIEVAAAQWAEANGSMQSSAVRIGNSIKGVFDNMRSSFGNFVRDVASGNKSVGNSFRAMAESIISSMLDIAAQEAATEIFGGLKGLIPKGFSFFGDGGGGADARARGGELRANQGRAIPTRDSVNVKAQPGEYILRKSAVQAIGRENLDKINAHGNRMISESAPNIPSSNDNKRDPDLVNVYVVSPDQVPPLSEKDVLATVQRDISNGGTLKKLVKQVAIGR
ncbi:phage tail tape measure protein [Kiloniella sp.]|uniref:phage tail tape measure protein n=1 Tax=Kiloniella sp. TaxID=1938587 RepID=UPI003B0202A3